MPETQPQTNPVAAGMDQPGPAAAAPVMESGAPVGASNLTQAGAPAYGEPGAAEQPSTTVPAGAPRPATPAGGHTKLLAMVQGIADGLAGASAGLASKGKVSGAQVVQELEAGRQQQDIKAQQAAQAKISADLQNKMTTAQTAQAVATTSHINAKFPDEMSQSHLKTQEMGQTNIGQAQDIRTKALQDFQTTGDLSAYNKTLTQLGSTSGAAPSAPGAAAGAAPAGTLPPTAVAGWKNATDTAALSYPQDKDIQAASAQFKAAQALPDQQAASVGMAQAARVAANRKAALDEATKSQTGQGAAAASTLKAAQEQGAQDIYNRTVEKNAQGKPVEDFATWQARTTKAAEVAVAQGDLTNMGKMAAEGLITIPQAALSRQMDTKGFQQFLDAADARAKELGAPEIVVNGKGTGHYFNAVAATQQYDYVKAFNAPGSKTQQSINSGSTFMEHMSDLLDVNAEYGRTNNKILNTPLNKIADTFGNEVYTKLMASIAPVKTEYDNALKAGFAPTAEDAATVDLLLKDNSTPGQIETAGKVMAHTILRRLDSTNEGYKTHTGGVNYPNMLTPDAALALQKMGIPTGGLQSGGGFGGPAQAGVTPGTTQAKAPRTPPAGVPAGFKLMQAPGGTPHWMSPDKIAAAQKLGATEVQ